MWAFDFVHQLYFDLRLSKIMTPIQYVLIILKYYDYNMLLSVFWIIWVELITYDMIMITIQYGGCI